MMSVAVAHRLGDFRLDAAFASEGGLTALFGRSGAGKTSLVNAIAGLIRPDFGRIAVEGETLTDTERGRFVPKHRRRIGRSAAESRAMGGCFVEPEPDIERASSQCLQRASGTDGEVGVAERHAGSRGTRDFEVDAASRRKRDADSDQVVPVDRDQDAVDVVVSVRSAADNAQREIQLCVCGDDPRGEVGHGR